MNPLSGNEGHPMIPLESGKEKSFHKIPSDINRELITGCFKTIGETQFLVGSVGENKFKFKIGKSVGEGRGGQVYAIEIDNSGKELVIKIAKRDPRFKATKALSVMQKKANQKIINEWLMLNILHKEGKVDGIQALPKFMVNIRERGIAKKTVELVEKKYLSSLKEFSFPDVKSILFAFQSLMKGLHFSLGNNIFHGDINIGNILVSKKGNLYLSDWGQAKFLPKDLDQQELIQELVAERLMTLNEVDQEEIKIHFKEIEAYFIDYIKFTEIKKLIGVMSLSMMRFVEKIYHERLEFSKDNPQLRQVLLEEGMTPKTVEELIQLIHDVDEFNEWQPCKIGQVSLFSLDGIRIEDVRQRFNAILQQIAEV